MSFAKFPRRAIPLAMGQMLEAATPGEATAMLAELPPPVRMMWALFFKAGYAARMRRLRGA